VENKGKIEKMFSQQTVPIGKMKRSNNKEGDGCKGD
jgi:hypothetical protein